MGTRSRAPCGSWLERPVLSLGRQVAAEAASVTLSLAALAQAPRQH